MRCLIHESLRLELFLHRFRRFKNLLTIPYLIVWVVISADIKTLAAILGASLIICVNQLFLLLFFED